LTGADGLQENELLARGVEHEERLQRRLRQAAEMAARAHRADEHTGVEKMVREPDPVAEQRALRARARWVDREHTARAALRASLPDQRRDETRIANAGRPADAHRVRTPRLRIDVMDEIVGQRVAVLDE